MEMEYIDANNKMFEGYIKFLHASLKLTDGTLSAIQEMLNSVYFAQVHFDALCIYQYTQSIRLSDGYVCGCAMLKLCRVAEAMDMKPSDKVASYISQRINACGGTSEMQEVEKWLGITCQAETVA